MHRYSRLWNIGCTHIYWIRAQCLRKHLTCPLLILQIDAQAKMAQKELKKVKTVMQIDELKCRRRVLLHTLAHKGCMLYIHTGYIYVVIDSGTGRLEL